MRTMMSVVTLFVFLLSLSCLAQNTQKEETDYEQIIRTTETVTGRKFGSRPVPDALRASALNNVNATEGFKFFSGHYRNLMDHPAMYAAGSGKDERLIVVGANVEKSFPIADATKAIEFYILLLKERGYHFQEKSTK